MIIPKTVMVLGVKYNVKVMTAVIFNGEEMSGICDRFDKVISLSKRQNKTKKLMLQTFFHELGHAIFYESSLIQTSISHDLEEMIVDIFSKVVADIV